MKKIVLIATRIAVTGVSLTLWGQSAFAQANATSLSCRFQLPGGYIEQTAVVLNAGDGELAGFDWRIDGLKGHCRVSADRFSVERLGNGERRYVDPAGCEVMSWSQGNRITLALPESAACSAFCSSSDARESLLPAVISRSGGCGE